MISCTMIARADSDDKHSSIERKFSGLTNSLLSIFAFYQHLAQDSRTPYLFRKFFYNLHDFLGGIPKDVRMMDGWSIFHYDQVQIEVQELNQVLFLLRNDR